ncbi:hypothetical protein DTW90_18315 [Neorhizobium sp. P12A]|uniref:hypothetical protein n=1 Tax=Neorhizobium sp. P12A TaxID=2268027 RepID=UPI0011EFC24B|nr:hypothetical protein [Neorhizobium sp. P12A]KAA0697386.1 hypothetical protein DTW90_18315 [Neorhizobium sp. P12A]
MIDEERERLHDQRSKFGFQIERAKYYLSGFGADAIKIINSKANLPAADIEIITEDLAEHLEWEIDAMILAIKLIDAKLKELDGDDDEYEDG